MLMPWALSRSAPSMPTGSRPTTLSNRLMPFRVVDGRELVLIPASSRAAIDMCDGPAASQVSGRVNRTR
jgi:hypothetical protein